MSSFVEVYAVVPGPSRKIGQLDELLTFKQGNHRQQTCPNVQPMVSTWFIVGQNLVGIDTAVLALMLVENSIGF